jgi:hypothetical protein
LFGLAELAFFLWFFQGIPCPTKNTAKAATNTVCSGNTTIEFGRPEPVESFFRILAHKFLSLLCQLNRIEHIINIGH